MDKYSSEGNERRKKVLFVGEHITPSHLARPMILATWLKSQDIGYDVEVAMSDGGRDFAEGLIVHELPSPERKVIETRVRKVLFPLYTKREIALMVKSEIELIERLKPDLIIHDFRNTLAISARVTNTPLVSLNDFYWNDSYPDTGIVPDTPLSRFVGYKLARKISRRIAPYIEKLHVSQFSAVAVSYGLEPFRSLRDLYNTDREQWLFDIPETFPERDESKTKFIGPVLWDKGSALPEEMEGLADASAICLTLTSSGNRELINDIIDSILPLEIPIVLLTAGQYIFLPRKNVYVATYAPLSLILKKSRLLISTGGSSVVYPALKASVPVIGIPQNITHWYSMTRFADMGIGVLVPSEEVKSPEFQSVVDGILKDTDYKIRTEKYRTSLNQFDPKKLVKSYVEKFLADG